MGKIGYYALKMKLRMPKILFLAFWGDFWQNFWHIFGRVFL